LFKKFVLKKPPKQHRNNKATKKEKKKKRKRNQHLDVDFKNTNRAKLESGEPD
jgi:hypothetical protein